MMEQNIDADASIEDLITEPAEDEMGYRHDDLEVGSTVVYDGEIRTVAHIGRSAIRLETDDGSVGIREGGIKLVVGVDD